METEEFINPLSPTEYEAAQQAIRDRINKIFENEVVVTEIEKIIDGKPLKIIHHRTRGIDVNLRKANERPGYTIEK